MDKEMVTKNKDGKEIKISVVGEFKIDELEKEYVIYSLVDDDETNKDGHLIIGEVIRSDNEVKVDGIKSDEKDLVMAYYSEISKQIGES